MTFPFDIYALAFLAGLVVTAASMPLLIRWAGPLALIDDPGHRKIHQQPVPLAGGLGVAIGLLLPLIAGAFIALWQGPAPVEANITYGMERRVWQLAAIALGAFGMLAIGLLDDRFELSPLPKFSGQTAAALLIASSGIRITLFIENPIFSYGVTVFWILAVTNAFNFIDNMNGLCGGLGAIAAWCCAWAAAVQGQYLVALLAFLSAGAFMGFLPYNFPKARAFLGDSGSHLVGFLCAVLSILPNYYSEQNPKALAVLSPLLFLSVPLIDLAWVTLYRTFHGKPFYVGDTNHLSHKLAAKGLSRTQVALVLWGAAAAAGSLTLWMLL